MNKTAEIDSSILELLSVLLPHLHPVSGNRSKAIQQISHLFDFLESHADRKISVEEMAKRCHLSVSRFHRVFRDATGLSPHAYVRNVKLENAVKIRQSLAEIAETTGFSDAFHLSRLFKREYGVSPSQFRKTPNPKFI